MFPRIAVIYVAFIIDEELSYVDVPATLKAGAELLGFSHLYTSGLIHRQTFVVGGKKRRRKSEIRKRHTSLSSARAQGASNLFFFSKFLLPTTLSCQNIKCNLYSYRGCINVFPIYGGAFLFWEIGSQNTSKWVYRLRVEYSTLRVPVVKRNKKASSR
jgi:hypothetical protein